MWEVFILNCVILYFCIAFWMYVYVSDNIFALYLCVSKGGVFLGFWIFVFLYLWILYFVFVYYQRWGWGWDGGTDGLKSGFLPPRSTSSSPPRNFTTSCENTFDCITIFLVSLTCIGVFNVIKTHNWRYCTFLQWGHSIAGKDSVRVKSALLPHFLGCEADNKQGYFCTTVENGVYVSTDTLATGCELFQNHFFLQM